MKYVENLPFWIFFCCSLVLCSCETELHKYNRLAREYEKIQMEIKELESDFRYLQAEQQKCWEASVKERFAALERINPGKWKNLYHGYVTGIFLEEKHAKRYDAKVKVIPQDKVAPYFTVFLYNDQGLIVGSKSYKAFWGVKAGKEQIYNVANIEVCEKPLFFRVDIIRE